MTKIIQFSSSDELLGPTKPDTSRFAGRSAYSRLKEIKPLSYVVENLLVKGYLYTLTARNNHGKTTLAALLVAAVSTGQPFAKMRTEQGRVLMLSGENAYDTDLKLKALGEKIDLTQVDVIDGSFDMRMEALNVVMENQHWIYSLVVCDSLQAFFGDGDMNSNGEALAHIKAFRLLMRLPGNPAVLTLAHPIKNPDPSNLVPYGGGSVMNEVDGNLTLVLSDNIATLGHTKLRQPGFMDHKFELSIHEFDDMTNNFGGKVTSSVFTAMDFVEAEKLEADIENNKLQIMRIIKSGGASKAGLARLVLNDDSDSAKGKIHRLIGQLRKDGFVEPKGDYRLTDKGQKHAKNI